MGTPHRGWTFALAVLTCVACSGTPSFGIPPDVPSDRDYYETEAEIVRDPRSGLTWQRHLAGSGFSIDEALAYCQSLRIGGHTDWRVPTLYELYSVVDFGAPSGAMIQTSAFLDMPATVTHHDDPLARGPQDRAAIFWSATPYRGVDNRFWALRFDVGAADYYGRHDTSYRPRVRCVRGPAVMAP